jgi:hypothetical protein
MRIRRRIVLAMLFGSLAAMASAAEMSLESLASILQENYDSVKSLEYEFHKSGILLEPGIRTFASLDRMIMRGESTENNSEKGTFWITDGKIRHDEESGPSPIEVADEWRTSWNGSQYFCASVAGASGVVSGSFEHDQVSGLELFGTSGFMLSRVSGYFNQDNLTSAAGKGHCPLALIQSELERRKSGVASQGVSAVDETVDGKRYVVFSEQYPDLKRPRYAYYFDPERSYSVVKIVRWADSGATDQRTTEVDVSLEEIDGHYVPKEVRTTYYGAYYAEFDNTIRNTPLYAKPINMLIQTMDRIKINEPIAASVFEADSIFDYDMRIWDKDKNITYIWGQERVEDTLKGLATELRKSVPLPEVVESNAVGLTPALREPELVRVNENMSRRRWLVLAGCLAAVVVITGILVRFGKKVRGTLCVMIAVVATASVAHAGEKPLAFENESYDMGSLAGPELVGKEAVFTFTVMGDKAITIKKVVPACGCNAVSLEKWRYFPGEGGAITVSFIAAVKDVVGKIDKTVFVSASIDGSNDDCVSTLTITGVVTGCVLKSQSLDFGEVLFEKEMATYARRIVVLYLGQHATRPLDLTVLDGRTRIHKVGEKEERQIIGGKEYTSAELRYVASPVIDQLEYGEHVGNCALVVERADLTVLPMTLELRYNRRWPIHAERTRVAFFKKGTPAAYEEISIPIVNTSNEKFTVSVLSADPWLLVDYNEPTQAIRARVLADTDESTTEIRKGQCRIRICAESGATSEEEIEAMMVY